MSELISKSPSSIIRFRYQKRIKQAVLSAYDLRNNENIFCFLCENSPITYFEKDKSPYVHDFYYHAVCTNKNCRADVYVNYNGWFILAKPFKINDIYIILQWSIGSSKNKQRYNDMNSRIIFNDKTYMIPEKNISQFSISLDEMKKKYWKYFLLA